MEELVVLRVVEQVMVDADELVDLVRLVDVEGRADLLPEALEGLRGADADEVGMLVDFRIF